jgi:Ca2+-binding EF-hand superfamily protein
MDRAPGPPSSPPPAFAYKRGRELLQARALLRDGDGSDGGGSGGGSGSSGSRDQLANIAQHNEQRAEAMQLLHAGDNMGELHSDTLKSIFALLDSDHDGLLDDAEVEQALVALGVPPLPFLVQEIKSHVPAWVGDKVDFATFQRVMGMRLRSNPVQIRDIQEVFRIFQDKEFGEGCVTETSLRHIMGLKPALAASLTPDEIDEIFSELGIKRRDVIDYRQFMEDISSGFVGFV